MPLQALQRQVIFSQQLQKSLKIFNCYWRWFQRLPLQKNLYQRKEKSFNKKLECTKIVQTIDYFLVL